MQLHSGSSLSPSPASSDSPVRSRMPTTSAGRTGRTRGVRKGGGRGRGHGRGGRRGGAAGGGGGGGGGIGRASQSRSSSYNKREVIHAGSADPCSSEGEGEVGGYEGVLGFEGRRELLGGAAVSEARMNAASAAAKV